MKMINSGVRNIYSVFQIVCANIPIIGTAVKLFGVGVRVIYSVVQIIHTVVSNIGAVVKKFGAGVPIIGAVVKLFDKAQQIIFLLNKLFYKDILLNHLIF